MKLKKAIRVSIDNGLTIEKQDLIECIQYSNDDEFAFLARNFDGYRVVMVRLSKGGE